MIAVAVDAILALVVVEGAALTLLHARTGQGPSPRALWPNLAAGFLLALAVRIALGGAAVPIGVQAALAAVLACALVAHLVDLAGRWRA